MYPIRVSISVLLFLYIEFGIGANILCIIPSPSSSHQIPFQPLWRKLHERGHHLTIVSPDPMKDSTLTNITEIDVHFLYDFCKERNVRKIFADEEMSLWYKGFILFEIWIEGMDKLLSASEVQKLIHNTDMKFDLLMSESLYPNLVAFLWRFHCPWISITSMDALIVDHFFHGHPVWPGVYPDHNLIVEDVDHLTFLERLNSFFLTATALGIFNLNSFYFDGETERMRKFFGQDLPHLAALYTEMSLMFLNVNPVFHTVRPMGPNIVTIGDGMHLLPPKPLPQELKDFLDRAGEGVIYFSLGGNVNSNLIKENMKRNIIDTFSELPVKILWKLDQNITQLPPNVKIQHWLPQQDILRHPNVKLFITQGGLQSLQEALSSFVPMVCLPFLGDQFQNCQKLQNKGAAVKLERSEITKETFTAAILEVLTNSKYRIKAKELGEFLQDQPMTGLDKAVWWTEYVLRHKGAKYLRSPAIDVPFYQYYFLDVLGFILTVVFIILFIIYKIFKYVVRRISLLSMKKKK